MNKATRLVKVGLLVLSIFCCTQSGWAQKKSDSSGEQRRADQVRKLISQNQELEAERAKLTKEKEEALAGAKQAEAQAKNQALSQVRAAQGKAGLLTRELAAARTRITEQDKSLQGSSAEVQKLAAQISALQSSSDSQLEQRSRNIELLNRDVARLQARVKELETQSAGYQEQGKGLSAQLQSCSGHNKRLVALVDEVSEKYRTKSCADFRSVVEPLVGLRRAEFDRIAEDYRSRAGEERYVAPLKP